MARFGDVVVEVLASPIDARNEGNTMYEMLVRVKGDQSERSRVNAVFVIDVSPSMDGERIYFAKDSIIKAVSMLGEGDSIAIVPFCRRAWIAYTARSLDEASRINAIRTIASLRTCPATNIEDGLRTGVKALNSLESGGSNILVLITDGEPNRGARDPESLSKIIAKPGRIHILIVGVGSNYNEELLAGLSRNLSGKLIHISDPLDLEKPILEEVLATARTVALGLKLRIESEGAVFRGYGWKHDAGKGFIEFNLGRLASNEVLEAGLEAESIGGDSLKLIISYTDPVRGSRVHQSSEISLKSMSNVDDNYIHYKLSIFKSLEEARNALDRGDYSRVYNIISEISEATVSLGDTLLHEQTVDIAELLRRGEIGEAKKKLYSTLVNTPRRIEGNEG